MKKIVLDIGNCNPDHFSLKSMLELRYDVEVLRAHELRDALQTLQSNAVDLILINRKLDVDYSDGTDILSYLKQQPNLQSIPVMIVTNYPDQQELAVSLGAEYGFGKLQYREPATHERLSKFLDAKSA